MSNNETTYKKPRIEKFKGKFKEIDGGGTILFTKTIQSIKNPNNLAVYVYLASKPPEWNVNVKELMSHFTHMGRDKIRKCLNDLSMMGLVERKEIRNETGTFSSSKYNYYIYLSPQPCFKAMDEPAPDLPAPDLPAPENQGIYKEKSSCIKNIDNKKGFSKTTNQETPDQRIKRYAEERQRQKDKLR